MTTKIRLLHDTVGIPTGAVAVTQSASDNTTKVATTAYVTTALANLADSAPSTLNTLNELAAALGDDANFSTTVTNSIAAKAPIAGPTFTGTATFNVDGDSTMTINDGGTNAMQIRAGAGDELYIGGNNAYALRFLNDGTNNVVFDNSSNVGIGTSSPSDRLHVALDSSTTNAEVEVVRIEATSSGTPAVGFGPFIDFRGDRINGGPDSYGRIGFEADLMPSTTVNGAFVIQSAIDGTYSEAVRVTSTKNLQITGQTTTFASNGFTHHTNNWLYLRGGSSGLRLDDDSSVNTIAIADGSSGFIKFETSNGSEKMRLNAAGNLGLGTNNPSFTAISGDSNQRGLHIENPNNDSSAQLKLTGRNNTGNPGQATSTELIHKGDALRFHVRHAGADTLVVNSDMNWHVNSGTSDTRIYLGSAGGAFGGNSSNWLRSSGGTLMYNCGGGSSSHIWEVAGGQALQITNAYVEQRTSQSDQYTIRSRNTASGDVGLSLTRDNVVGFGIAVRGAAEDYVDFQVNSSGATSFGEAGKMRIYHNGSISIPNTALWTSGVGHVFSPTAAHYQITTSSSTGDEKNIVSNTVGSGGAAGMLQYRHGGSVRGDFLVATYNDGIYFNQGSDYRFKENINTITDSYLTKLTSLRPITYTHKASYDSEDSTTKHVGFVAHEVQEVFPEFVIGTKDAVYTQEDLDKRTEPVENVGDPLYQTVAYSRKEWNVYIVRALQELKAENEALKARITTLEG